MSPTGITAGRIIIPADNENDLEIIPEEVREAIQFVPVARIDEVWEELYPGVLD